MIGKNVEQKILMETKNGFQTFDFGVFLFFWTNNCQVSFQQLQSWFFCDFHI
jgi:hypothetical protein